MRCNLSDSVLAGFLSEMGAAYVAPSDKINPEDEQHDLGDIRVDWQVQKDPTHIKQFNVSWKNLRDGDAQTKVVDAGVTSCTLPATSRK